MPRIIDISQTLATGIAVWPGDTPFAPFWMMTMEHGESVNVGSVTMSLHTGTHADSPRHFRNDGASPVDCDLSVYIGRALVVDLSAESPAVTAITEKQVAAIAALRPERVLFRTGTASAGAFTNDFAHFSADAAEALVTLGVRLVGIDTPSVDHPESKTLGSHHAFDRGKIAILENLVLNEVSAGWYELIALPLKFADMDASPVRAVLRTLD
jgi:arylformamidase